jgi:hypothetical protein
MNVNCSCRGFADRTVVNKWYLSGVMVHVLFSVTICLFTRIYIDICY